MVDLLKWLRQQDTRRNSLQKDLLHCPLILFLRLISKVIPGNMEPWPECQPEQLAGSFVLEAGYLGLAFFAGWEACRFLADCQTA